MTGRRWRLATLLSVLAVVGFVVRLWWISEDPFLFALAVVMVLIWAVLWALDVEEKPTCGRVLSPTIASYSTHTTHHCHFELGHAGDQHECRCGLVAFPPKAATGVGSLQVVLDSVPEVA